MKVGDKLICTDGNTCYVAGEVYTVGDFINDKYFKIRTGFDNGYWYATKDDEGIYVRFNSKEDQVSDAWFDELEHQDYA